MQWGVQSAYQRLGGPEGPDYDGPGGPEGPHYDGPGGPKGPHYDDGLAGLKARTTTADSPGHFVCLSTTTAPSFITQRMPDTTASMSFSGSPSTATTSAR